MSANYDDFVKVLRHSQLKSLPQMRKDAFIEATGRDMSECATAIVHLRDKRSILIEGPFEIIGDFLLANTPFEKEGSMLIRFDDISTVDVGI